MGRPKKAAPAYVEPEDASQDIDDEDEAVTEFNRDVPSGKAVKKAEAVRRALAAGHDSPDAGTDFIKKTFGIDMEKQHFSSVKSQQLKKQREASPAKAPRAPKAGPAESYVAPPVKAKVGSEGDVLVALESVKELVAEYGADKVRRLVDLLS